MNKNKLISNFIISSLLLSSSFLLYSLNNKIYASEQSTSSITDAFGGIPIGENATYTFESVGGSTTVCQLSNQSPEIDHSVTGQCITNVPGGFATPPYQSVSQTYETGGSHSMKFSTTIWKCDDGCWVEGTSSATINMNVYQGETTLANESSQFFEDTQDANLQCINGVCDTPSSKDYSCKDWGTCPEFSCESNGSCSVDCQSNGTCTVNYTDGKDASSSSADCEKNGTCTSSCSGSSCTITPNNNNNDNDNNSNDSLPSSSSEDSNDYGEYVNNKMNDNNNTYNANDADWSKSDSGSDGNTNLDNYFNNTTNQTNNNDITTDNLGNSFSSVNNSSDSLSKQYEFDSDGDGIIDSWDLNKDGIIDAWDTDRDGIPDKFEDDSTIINEDNVFNNAQNDFMDILKNSIANLDGYGKNIVNNGFFNSKNNSNSNSLIADVKKIINNSEISSNETLSDQKMFNLAKNMISSTLGYSDIDLRKGINYDEDSAYTDPARAWDFNRITTLLKNKKIKINNN